MVCPQCDAGVRDDARFCLNCGAPLAAGDAASAPTQQVPAVDTTPAAEQPPAAVAPDLTDCPSCGAPNSGSRRRCGRCGADLATGRPADQFAPRPTRRGPAPDPGPPEAAAGPRRRTFGLIIAAAIVAGAAVGILAAAGVGPFQREPAAPVAVFDAGVYVGQPRPLPVAAVQASSTHAPQDENRYEAARTTDGDLTTAWNSDGSTGPDGVGESLRFVLRDPAWISGFVIANGYQKDDRSFVANARVRRVRVSFGGSDVYDVSVLDQPGRQVVTFTEPVLAAQMTFTVLETYAGDTYDDLAISEVEVRGWTALGGDVDLVEGPPAPDGDQPGG